MKRKLYSFLIHYVYFSLALYFMCVGGKHIRKKSFNNLIPVIFVTGIKLLKFNLNLCVTQYEIYKTINKKVIKKGNNTLKVL